MNKLISIICCLLISFPSLGQLSFLRKIPVKPVMDIGFTTFANPPEELATNMLGSRTINIAALYEVYITDHFTFNTGLGISIERYSFQKNITLREAIDQQGNSVVATFPIPYKDVRKSLITPTYLDIPIELRAVTSTGRKTFRFILGFKVGVLLAAHNKIKYGTGDNIRTEKFKDDFFLNRFHYGVYSRIGYKSVHLYTYYSLSDLFQPNKLAPNQAAVPLMVGLSFMMF